MTQVALSLNVHPQRRYRDHRTNLDRLHSNKFLGVTESQNQKGEAYPKAQDLPIPQSTKRDQECHLRDLSHRRQWCLPDFADPALQTYCQACQDHRHWFIQPPPKNQRVLVAERTQLSWPEQSGSASARPHEPRDFVYQLQDP